MKEEQISSKTLMSLIMIRQMPIKKTLWLSCYRQRLNDNKTLESTSMDRSGFMSKSGIHHLSFLEYLKTLS